MEARPGLRQRVKAAAPAPAGWNLFRATEQDRGSVLAVLWFPVLHCTVQVSERKYDAALLKSYKGLKMLTMVAVFCLTLAAATVAKGATFFMVGQVTE